jgi:uncharacterized membrane protein YsdA (DUF1294 family)
MTDMGKVERRDPFWTWSFIAVMLIFLALWLGSVMDPLLAWITAMTTIFFILYGMDKLRSGKGADRIPESLLIVGALLGGCAGATLGMFLFRHKISKPSFRMINMVSMVLWGSIVLYAEFWV